MCVESVIRLLARAWTIGMVVELDGEDLVLTAPRSSEALVDEIRAKKADIVAHLRQLGCGALHIRPERWKRINAKAFCPRCRQFMGYAVTTEELPEGGTSHAR